MTELLHLILDYDECKKILRDTLFHAVEDTMVSDEPIGTFLSGGIDSTIITGIVSKLSKNPIDTFTIGYNNKRNDESSLSSLASQLHKTNPHIFYLNYEDVLPELDKLIDNLDEPFADSSYIPTYMVSKFAKQHVRTVLTGDSGDELFGGYSKYLIGHYAEKYNKVPKWCRTMFEHAVYRVPDTLSITRKLRKVIVNADKDIFEQRKELMCLGFKDYELQALLTEEYKVDDSLSFIKGYYDTLQIVDDELSNALYTDFKVVLEGDMLPKVSRASKLASLETRVPMLHKDVVELAARIPSRFKINTNNTKIILKDTFKDLIPKELFSASKKGFGVPVGDWFRNELKQDLVNTLDKDLIHDQGIFDSDAVQMIINEHMTKKVNRASELWVLYIFEKWFNQISREHQTKPTLSL